MQLISFRVQNFRSIIDSGWLEAGSLNAFSGFNESGKTVLLSALYRFNPVYKEGFSPNRDWPRHIRHDVDQTATVVQCRFALDSKLRDDLQGFPDAPREVVVSKKYDGSFECEVVTADSKTYSNPPDFINQIVVALTPTETLSEEFSEALQGLRDYVQKTVANEHSVEQRISVLDRLIEGVLRLKNHAKYSNEYKVFNELYERCVAIKEQQDRSLNAPSTGEVDVSGVILPRIPTFFYWGNCELFDGVIDMLKLKENRDQGQLSGVDRQRLSLLHVAGLDLDTVISKLDDPDKEQLVFDLQDASNRLSSALEDYWSGSKKRVVVQGDGSKLIVFMSESQSAGLIRMDEQAYGMRFFVALEIGLKHNGISNPNSVVLLDEPDFGLGGANIRGLAELIEHTSHTQQVFFTTVNSALLKTEFKSPKMGHIALSDACSVINYCMRDLKDGGTIVVKTSLEELNLFLSNVDQKESIEPKKAKKEVKKGVLEPKVNTKKSYLVGVESNFSQMVLSYIASQLNLSLERPLSPELLFVNTEVLGVDTTLGSKIKPKDGVSYSLVLNTKVPITLEDLVGREFVLNALNNTFDRRLGYARIGVKEVEKVANEKGVVLAALELFNHKLIQSGSNDVIKREEIERAIAKAVTSGVFADIPSGTVDNFVALFAYITKKVSKA